MGNLRIIVGVSTALFSVALFMSYLEVKHLLATSSFFDHQLRFALAHALLRTKFRVVSVIAITFSLILLLGKLTQFVFFGQLREEERSVSSFTQFFFIGTHEKL